MTATLGASTGRLAGLQLNRLQPADMPDAWGSVTVSLNRVGVDEHLRANLTGEQFDRLKGFIAMLKREQMTADAVAQQRAGLAADVIPEGFAATGPEQPPVAPETGNVVDANQARSDDWERTRLNELALIEAVKSGGADGHVLARAREYVAFLRGEDAKAA